MRDVLDDLLRAWDSGGVSGVATVVRTWQSAPRRPGASMLVAPGGEAVGSVSGGCVEGPCTSWPPRSPPTPGRGRCCSATASATTTRTPSG
ncbi:XdhC family protein [Catellatospora coxensis]